MTVAEELAAAEAALAAIQTAMARGERSVQFSDRSTTYRSMEELIQARQFWISEVARLNGRPRQVLGYSTKGF